MKIENLNKTENALLSRDEYTARVAYSEATPSRSDLIKAVAAQAKAKEALVVVKKLEGNYGGGSASLEAYVYKNDEALQKVEREYMRTRNVVKEEEKPEEPEEKPAESAEEKPAEKEKSEDAPAEEKKEASE
jgi:ribosomal protein S24E